MTFNDNIRIDTSNTSSGGRGGGRGLALGGGATGIIALLVYLFFGDDTLLQQSQTQQTQVQQQQPGESNFEHCQTGADANAYQDCRIIATTNSLEAVWEDRLVQSGVDYRDPSLTIFTGQVNTGCGAASSAVGPFYCPADETMYFDTDFFSVMVDRLGASEGALAEEYVVAHEFGHHIQNLINQLGRAQQDPQGPESGAVRVELMADCFAGVWAHHASQSVDPQTGEAFMEPLTDRDIQIALDAAASVGDDRIQQKTQGQITPHTWTHGSAEQRQQWFLTGYRDGDPNKCNTFERM